MSTDRITSGYDFELQLSKEFFQKSLDQIKKVAFHKLADMVWEKMPPIVQTLAAPFWDNLLPNMITLKVDIPFSEKHESDFLKINITIGISEKLSFNFDIYATVKYQNGTLILCLSHEKIPEPIEFPIELPTSFIENIYGSPAIVKIEGTSSYKSVIALLVNLNLKLDSKGKMEAPENMDSGKTQSFISNDNEKDFALGIGKHTYGRIAKEIRYEIFPFLKKQINNNRLHKIYLNSASLKSSDKDLTLTLKGEYSVDNWFDPDLSVKMKITPNVENRNLSFSIEPTIKIEDWAYKVLFAIFGGPIFCAILGGPILRIVIPCLIDKTVNSVEDSCEDIIKDQLKGKSSDLRYLKKDGIFYILEKKADMITLVKNLPNSTIPLYPYTPKEDPLYTTFAAISIKYHSFEINEQGLILNGAIEEVLDYNQSKVISIKKAIYENDKLVSLLLKTNDGYEQMLSLNEIYRRHKETEQLEHFTFWSSYDETKYDIRLPKGKLPTLCLTPIKIKKSSSRITAMEFKENVIIQVDDLIKLQKDRIIYIGGYVLVEPKEGNAYYRAYADKYKTNNLKNLPKIKK